MEIIEVCEVLIINSNQQVLLQLRDKDPKINGSAKWGMIGGGKEIKETPLECIKREVREELGLDITPIFISEIEDIGGDKIYHHFIYSFLYQGNIQNIFLREGQKIKFFGLKEIMELDKVEWFERVYLSVIKKLDINV
ncbi:MAG: NUDIX domain-containing protein [Patescibacteria group bacterium]